MSSSGIFSRRHTRSGLCIFIFFLWPALIFAQEEEVSLRGGFLSDSIKIGEQTAFYLSARHPSQLTVLFPDSTHSFLPFEYLRKAYFPTETTGGISVDSAVYYVTTFEIDRVQYLNLPVYIAHALDCTVVSTETDSLLITQFVADVPDTVTVAELPLRMNTAYQKVNYDLNFWLIVIAISVFSIVTLVIWLTFGKKIRQYFHARKLQKNHAYFLERYNTFLRQLQTAFSPPATESALATWKNYMEQLESRPYTKLTTRETLKLIKEPAVTEDLRKIDNAIYGHNTSVVDALENLRLFADQQFKRKLREVQHGK